MVVLDPVPSTSHTLSHILNLVTNLNTAHAFDTFGRIANQRKVLIPWLSLDLGFIRIIKYVQVVGNLLQAAVAASWAGHAFTVML